MQRMPIGLALLGSLTVLACACGSAPHAAGGSTIVVGTEQAGTTVHAQVGDTIRVKLQDSFPVPGSSLVWSVNSSSPSILSPTSTTAPTPAPMLGQSPYVADFLAQTSGQATLNARGATTCEAMAKQSCPDQTFTITVLITG